MLRDQVGRGASGLRRTLFDAVVWCRWEKDRVKSQTDARVAFFLG